MAVNDEEWNQFVYDSISDISSDDELFVPDLAKSVKSSNITHRDMPTIDNNIKVTIKNNKPKVKSTVLVIKNDKMNLVPDVQYEPTIRKKTSPRKLVEIIKKKKGETSKNL